MDDIAHISKKGVMKAKISTGPLSVQIMQLHGRQGILRKWTHLFEGITSIVFYASLSGYDRLDIDRNQWVRISTPFPPDVRNTCCSRVYKNPLSSLKKSSTRVGSRALRSYCF